MAGLPTNTPVLEKIYILPVLTGIAIHVLKVMRICFVNPLNPKSDQHQNSPCNFNALQNRGLILTNCVLISVAPSVLFDRRRKPKANYPPSTHETCRWVPLLF